MDIQSFEGLQLKLNDGITLRKENGEEIKGFYMGEYNAGGKTFAFSNFVNGSVEVILIEQLQQLIKG
ncbi:hypothetical protein A0256_01910 [Mucilaginibacter sp. PAMC 26640]|nr:hypothetical protein A0256_01910 [Mucilaginibacter sp. PAMC 26640]